MSKWSVLGKFLDAAEIVLKLKKEAMSAKEIVTDAIASRSLEGINGKTPEQTLKARLSQDIRNNPNSKFIRTAAGTFGLKEWEITPYVGRRFEKKIRDDEYVLVVPTKIIDQVGRFQGIITDYKPYMKAIFNPKNFSFMPRKEAEINYSYKQILSYVVIKNKKNILRFQRGSYTNVDSFLKGRFSIGFGGHVTKSDRNIISWSDGGYAYSVKRELNEELDLKDGIDYGSMPPIIGILNDDTSLVGKAHIAFIHLLEIKNQKITKGEKSINQLKFISISDIDKEFESHEFWSKLCIKKFFQHKLKLKAAYKPFKKIENIQNESLFVVGRIGSGKTEFCEYLSKKYNYHRISTSEVLRDIINSDSITNIGRKKFQEKAEAFINSKNSPKIFAQKIFEMIKNHDGKSVIDGIRNQRTMFELKNLIGNLPLIYIETTPDDAYRFYKTRENKNATFDDFAKILSHPIEKEIPLFVEHANFIFYNYGNYRSFLKVIDKWYRSNLT